MPVTQGWTQLCVNITAFGWEFTLFERHPAFQLKCPAFCFCVFRIDHVISICITLCVLSVWNLNMCIHGRRLSSLVILARAKST